MLAVRAGDDDLAKEALARKQEHDNIGGQFQQQWLQQKDAVEKLKDALRAPQQQDRGGQAQEEHPHRAEEARRGAEGDPDDDAGLSRHERVRHVRPHAPKIDQIEAEAEAGAELAGELTGDTLESKFKQLETAARHADEALAELKAKMGLALPPAQAGSSQGQLPAAGNTTNNNANSQAQAQAQGGTASSLTAEDLKELEELNLGEEASPPKR